MTGLIRFALAALSTAVLLTGTLEGQARPSVVRHQVHRSRQLQWQGDRLQRQAWRMDRHAERLRAEGHGSRAARLQRESRRRWAHGLHREWRGELLRSHGWI